MYKKILRFVFIMSLLWQSLPAVAAGGDVENPLSAEYTQESMRNLTIAPQPFGEIGVIAASTLPQAAASPNEECFWASGGANPLDEQASNSSNGNWTIKLDHTAEEVTPFSGIADYRASNTGGTNPLLARLDAKGRVADVDNIVRTYAYGAFRVIQSPQAPPTLDKLYFRVKKGGDLIVDFTEIANSGLANSNWQTWSFTLPGAASSYRNQDVTLELWAETSYYGRPSTMFIVDYSGVAYCTGLPDINVSSPLIVDPASINTLYQGLLIRQETTLWTHVGSGGIVYSSEFKSMDEIMKDNQFYQAAFRLKPPFDKKVDYLRSFNNLWFSQTPQQKEHMVESILRRRLPTSEKLEEMITDWRTLAERQEAAGNAVRQAEVSRWMQQQLELRRDYLNGLSDLQRRVTLTPVTYVVEMSPSQLSTLSRNNLGWVSAYSLNGREPLSIIRGLEFPEDTADDVITEIWREAVKAGAPRAMKIVRGGEAVRIGFWEQFKVGLRYSLPGLISAGYNSAVNSFYLYRAYAIAAAEKGGEFVPWVEAAAATIGAGDAAWDLYTYQNLGTGETSQDLTDYLLTQNVFYRLMVGTGLIEYTEQVIGQNWSLVQFCFPEHELWYHAYPNYQLKTMVIPAVCGSGSYMEWKIKEASGDRLTIEKNTGGPIVELDLSKTIGSARYSIYLDDPEVGLIAQTFIIQLIQYDPSRQEGRFNIYWLSTETPEQQGLCAGASPTRPDDKPCAVPQGTLFLPLIDHP